MKQPSPCTHPAAPGASSVPGLQQGSKLHHILQEQGDLQQLPAWLQGDTPLDPIPASPTMCSKQELQDHLTANARGLDAAASDDTVAELSSALAALQEAILHIDIPLTAQACLAAAIGEATSVTSRKRLKFEAYAVLEPAERRAADSKDLPSPLAVGQQLQLQDFAVEAEQASPVVAAAASTALTAHIAVIAPSDPLIYDLDSSAWHDEMLGAEQTEA